MHSPKKQKTTNVQEPLTTKVQRIDQQPNKIKKELANYTSCDNHASTSDTFGMPTFIHVSKIRKFDSATFLSLESFVKKLDMIINTSKEAQRKSFCLLKKIFQARLKNTIFS